MVKARAAPAPAHKAHAQLKNMQRERERKRKYQQTTGRLPWQLAGDGRRPTGDVFQQAIKPAK